MKLSEAIEQVRLEKPHSFSPDHCTLFLTEIEAQVQDYLGIPASEWVKYDWKEDGNEELIVPAPYDALYISYLKAKIDYSTEEYESYANNAAVYEDDMEKFKSWAIREGKIRNKTNVKIKNWW